MRRNPLMKKAILQYTYRKILILIQDNGIHETFVVFSWVVSNDLLNILQTFSSCYLIKSKTNKPVLFGKNTNCNIVIAAKNTNMHNKKLTHLLSKFESANADFINRKIKFNETKSHSRYLNIFLTCLRHSPGKIMC